MTFISQPSVPKLRAPTRTRGKSPACAACPMSPDETRETAKRPKPNALRQSITSTFHPPIVRLSTTPETDGARGSDDDPIIIGRTE